MEELENADIQLSDIVTSADTQRLFDTLQSSVQLQYSGRPYSFDVSALHNYDDPPVSIRNLNKKYKDVLFEGDMAIPQAQMQRIVKGSVEGENRRRRDSRGRRQANLDANYPTTIWEKGVPFVLHSSLNPKARDTILRAIHFWYRETCIDFKPRTTEEEYLSFIGNDDGCWSTVGRDASQGRQVVSIGQGCEHFGVTSHELAHALGVFHEQSRYDRDNAVIFNPNVVEKSLLYNFAKISPTELSTYDLPYDVGSVMHYTPTEFSVVKSVPALTTVDPNLQQSMGQLEGPSFLDVLIINQHYKCAERCAKKVPCQNGGFVNSRNCRTCKCPSGFGGKFCDQVPSSFSRSCGGVINVEQTTRKFDISISQKSEIRSKDCFYHLKAPPGKRILVNLLKINAKCIEGCWKDGVEFKMTEDSRPVGYRFCCRTSSRRRLLSKTNLVPLTVFSHENDVILAFEYSYVDKDVRFDDDGALLGIQNDVIERFRNETDGVSATVSSPGRNF
ncbi:unnamed protein product [Caenorhabditis auriculariae]|uniref:Zinc metalloproteinase n=1 Tax=Caenorhabditis auriculariae TaxID=2777116 RepID=A0A8S1HDK8_9PELO|nr:unnamed protein product [Caenorhabditis auriculariae]